MVIATMIPIDYIEEKPEIVISMPIPKETITSIQTSEEPIKISCNNPQADFRADVERFLANDSTNNNIYIDPDYCCTHFSTDLVTNMRIAGFHAHKLILRTPQKRGHAMVFIYGPDSNLIIESITDQIFDADSDEIDEHCYNVLGYYPEIIKIQN